MRFMMFVATDSNPDAKPEAPDEIETWVDDPEKSGKRIAGDRLRPAGAAKAVRVCGGRKMITDEPFTESREVIVGLDILECESLDEAVVIAARHPMARAGRLEVRAF